MPGGVRGWSKDSGSRIACRLIGRGIASVLYDVNTVVYLQPIKQPARGERPHLEATNIASLKLKTCIPRAKALCSVLPSGYSTSIYPGIRIPTAADRRSIRQAQEKAR
ncbi:hypothetical protein E1301_Tti004094 [Triplophysa tibetana]|uniref:Uncharacterized protein n=1 Tax=Triplophysa tibetana TaxID=1572043 RepID=A0A5A9NKM6_9TELE|nr:hypothetical protein E1301_Tti004094 [Triplophysa tibetana]